MPYYGIKKNIYILAIGYFLHGCWDITYRLLQDPALIPPNYDLFGMSLDFTVGLYLLIFSKQFLNKKIAASRSFYNVNSNPIEFFRNFETS